MSSNYEWQRLEVQERINRPMREAQDHRLARQGKKDLIRTILNILTGMITFPFRLISGLFVVLQANKSRQPSEVAE